MKIFTLFSLIIFSAIAKDVEVINSMHGGIVKKTDTAIVEFVQTGDAASLYISGRKNKNLTHQKLSVTAIANIKGVEYPMNLSYENDHYSLSPYAKLKDEKNFVVSFTISFPFPGKAEQTSFRIGK
jgi:hypothetical protein